MSRPTYRRHPMDKRRPAPRVAPLTAEEWQEFARMSEAMAEALQNVVTGMRFALPRIVAQAEAWAAVLQFQRKHPGLYRALEPLITGLSSRARTEGEALHLLHEQTALIVHGRPYSDLASNESAHVRALAYARIRDAGPHTIPAAERVRTALSDRDRAWQDIDPDPLPPQDPIIARAAAAALGPDPRQETRP